ncbi:HTH type 11 transcriptional regulator [Amycolatopsis mediterranei S699]|uniref:HTH type 11 transcriptional regulator n=2 Tax=Amycolatopsis mediterranei TaxID=33910 RepID=A0A0H3D6L4_AMYMU|nr:WYL domain-containing protein [Amycolatopsis mediterranei]ADJ46650.1 HTH type 11 transcriptional regulator [Amycolatopsis mediterranei U32]AEK43450.1 HTH type 11 transcriptional regulator [Amycolatopsis mediterranei S699]AFO78361.1 HTH type 11 transcriptional regulator [Amycolatopsis mediterranei S699]AGT85489.1 HTH type 11 transcriptional regulator [Amycolatopsis mediterranei RB]KDO11448.1 protein pafC [Amycolatopsis mediterranei]
MSGSTDRMPRLLALVPYLLARPGVRIDDAAQDFDVSPKQLRKDLELLWMCGLPGYGPGDLIDLSFEGDTIIVTHDAGMSRPLRLTGGEATALLVALRALAETPGVVDGDAVRRSIAKIEAAAGQAQPAGVVVGGGVREGEKTARTREEVARALRDGRALRIRYYTASKDQITERTVDPMRLLIVQAVGYLEAWCRRAEDVRLFRLDRIDELTVLDEPARPPAHAHPTDISEGVFRERPDQREAVLVLDPDARWVAEYYPCEELDELDGGRLRIRMRYADQSWMVRLVLGLGGEALVESPADLASDVGRRAADAVARARHLPSTCGH